jgi:hypothetical protein
MKAKDLIDNGVDGDNDEEDELEEMLVTNFHYSITGEDFNKSHQHHIVTCMEMGCIILRNVCEFLQ